MIVKHAVWEKRNLNVAAYEISVGAGDSLPDLQRALAGLEGAEYVVVKTPTNHKEFLWGMPGLGFTCLESQILLKLKKSDFRPIGYLKRFEDVVSVQKAAPGDAERIYDNILQGLFDTDRISLDTAFTVQDANRRYRNWAEDSVGAGGTLYEMSVKGDPAGFFVVLPPSGKKGYPGLCAMYPAYRGKGFGALLVQKAAQVILGSGCDTARTGVSSNNLSVLNVHIALGYMVDDMQYVYVKHTRAR